MQNNKIYKNINEYFLDFPEDRVRIVPLQEINQAQHLLNVKFSEQYVNFIKENGAAGIGANYIHGFSSLPLMDKNTWHIVDKTNFYKITQQWPNIDDWYIISDDGRGNPIGCKPDGSVWLSDHDSNFEQIKLADNFEEFLYKLLTDTLYE